MILPEPILLLLAGAVVSVYDVSGYYDGDGMPPWGITASGVPTGPAIVACGPAYPFGTQFFTLDDDMERVVYDCFDRGGAIHNGRLDTWWKSRAAALRFGRRAVRMAVLLPEAGACQ